MRRAMRARAEVPVMVLSALAWLAVPAGAQVVNPATSSTAQGNQGGDGQGSQAGDPGNQGGGARLRTYEMPAITVYGKAPIADDERIGTYAQPRWTGDRLFSETRVYVIPANTVQFEYWFRPTIRKDNRPTKFQSLYEVEFGLPHRLQLDLYAVANKVGSEGALAVDGQKVELRYALADWGKIWGNPTLYFEWSQANGGADSAEVKLLLGGGIAPGWHWGSNLVWEMETGGAKELSREWTVGVSRTVRERKASVGVETQLAFVNEIDNGQRTDADIEFLVGPSFQFRPARQIHFDLAPLFGVTGDAPRAKLFAIFGWEF